MEYTCNWREMEANSTRYKETILYVFNKSEKVHDYFRAVRMLDTWLNNYSRFCTLFETNYTFIPE